MGWNSIWKREIWSLELNVAYLDTALLTCSVCELLNSLESEVKYIWHGTRNIGQICYILVRYICIASFVFFLAVDATQSSVPGDSTVNKNKTKTDWLLNINLLFVEIIFSLRTWALWKRSKKMGVWLCVLMVLLWGSNFGLVIAYTASSSDKNVARICSTSFAAFYFIIMILVSMKAYRARHELNISLIRLVHLQGLTYYTLVFIMSLPATVITWTGHSDGLPFVTRLVQFAFTHLACRMSLSLRAQNSRPIIDLNSDGPCPREENTTIPLGDFNFRHSVGSAYTTGRSRLSGRFERLQPQDNLALESASSQAA